MSKPKVHAFGEGPVTACRSFVCLGANSVECADDPADVTCLSCRKAITRNHEQEHP